MQIFFFTFKPWSPSTRTVFYSARGWFCFLGLTLSKGYNVLELSVSSYKKVDSAINLVTIMKQQGKFLLLTLKEFEKWLSGLGVMRKIKLVQNHHTWIPDYTLFNSKPENYFPLLNAIEKSHLERGFDQIAQNITTFPDGLIAICRSFEIIPAGIKGANSFGICIEHIGNFDGKDAMTAKHRKSIVKVNGLLCKKFKLVPNTNTIVYHHWYDLITGNRVPDGSPNTKTCPGTMFFGGNTIAACAKNFIPLVKNAVR